MTKRAVTKLEWIKRLAELDHAFVTEQFSREICEALGAPVYVERRRVDPPGTFKGLSAWDDQGNDLPTGAEVRGADAANLAEHLCQHAGVRTGHLAGRGSRLRYAVAQLRNHYEGGEKLDPGLTEQFTR